MFRRSDTFCCPEIETSIITTFLVRTSFEKAVRAILNCKNGKIVISGAGKSGIIGRKISSTFSSIGIPSFFVDAGACSHGELGVISYNDIVILISNSGESEELKNIIKECIVQIDNKPIQYHCLNSKGEVVTKHINEN